MLDWEDGHKIQYCSPVGVDSRFSDFWEGDLKNFVQPIFRPYDILCQILVESTKIMQVLIDFFLNISWFTVLKQIVTKLVSLHQSYRFSELVIHQVAS